MLPSVVAKQTASAVQQFLKGAFAMSTPLFRRESNRTAIDDFVDAPDVLMKGPYLSMALPFRKSTLAKDYFDHLNMMFTPYAHQAKAFQRLSGVQPKGTLVATGTGSGKTECFMYPILNHCAVQNRAGMRDGIKAIIIYPMNALATDQAKRFAETIGQNPKLAGLSVGLFVGAQESSPSRRMNPAQKQVITCKDTLRDNPPDILLTNYKMLDYLLIRPEDQKLWRHNTEEMLQYLVVDELHTFDGAQGTDLACLIRRLKYRLNTPDDFLACVGTSATVGDEKQDLIDYAQKIFDCHFDDEAIVNEDRYGVREFFAGFETVFRQVPLYADKQIDPSYSDSIDSYINKQIDIWFEDDGSEKQVDKSSLYLSSDLGKAEREERCVQLGSLLMEHQFLQWLLNKLQSQITDAKEMADYFSSLLNIEPVQALALIESFVTLVSVARRESEGSVLPFLQVRYQLWLRELRRLVASVSEQPRLTFSDDVVSDELEKHLPVINCRDCGVTGWAGVLPTTGTVIEDDLESFYRHFFTQNPDLCMAFPAHSDTTQAIDGPVRLLCCDCLAVNSSTTDHCVSCSSTNLISVVMPKEIRESSENGVNRNKFKMDCPCCGSAKGLSVMGSRASSLTSVMIHQLYGSRYNDDKKLITFSDSVQDAAHHAGFYGSRTWPLMLRSAIAATLANEETVNLSELSKRVVEYARNKSVSTDVYVAKFIANNMEWMGDYQHLLSEGSLPKKKKGEHEISTLVDGRLEWETFKEFGLHCSIGRSLERSAFAAAAVPIEVLAPIADRLQHSLAQEFGSLQHVTSTMVLEFLVGVLTKLRQQGGIQHTAFKSYMFHGDGKTYSINDKRTPHGLYMPGFGPSTRTPLFLSVERIGASYTPVIQSKSKKTWLQNWLEITLGVDENVMVSADTGEVYRACLGALTQGGILIESDTRDNKPGWAITPEAIEISKNVTRFACERCGDKQVVPSSWAGAWTGMCCLNASCSGQYQVDVEQARFNWDQVDCEKVIAAEHTGLLEREAREATERSFMSKKAERNSWDVNLLSATPTLEMGIDIGDLSSVVLCSVPPAQANYLQRIGRAGRSDGNAFNVTLAEGNPHDLFFYAEPIDMMAGHVKSPGVFMNALAVLERQLTAFCMDNWVAQGVDNGAVDKKVRQMLNSVSKESPDKFPFNFIAYVEENKGSLLREFCDLFDSVSEEEINHLSAYIRGEGSEFGLGNKIISQLRFLLRDRDSLIDRIKTLTKEIKKRKDSPVKDQNFEKEIRDLEEEKQGLNKLVNSINEKQTLNFLTDEGLLPNYAFPEAGVTLRSVLWRRNEKNDGSDGTQKYLTSTYEYERPAAVAISELAPNNFFYAGGHKVQIEQVDLDVSEVEKWRLCSNCNHSVNITLDGDEHKVCPRCGAPNWHDGGQLTDLLKLRQVYARSPDDKSRIHDDSDNREPQFYTRQLLVDFERKDVRRAYHIDSERVPFGFEFINKAQFKDINFGSPDESSPEFEVAGQRMKRGGFRVCKSCGVVQNDRGDATHSLSCKFKSLPSEPEHYINCLYLYREIESEALRILLPITTFGKGSVTETSFSAAIHMGLERYFKGDVSHIHGAVYDEPINEGEGRKHFLCIYDSVPGGTGYLKELMRSPDNLLKLVELAYEALEQCSCNDDPTKDGCYRCLFAYRDRRNMRSISRDRAKEILREILDNSQKLNEIDSINEIDLSKLEGSELERKFIETLKASNKQMRLSHRIIQGKNGYELTFARKRDDGEIELTAAWHVEPQVNINSADKVAKSSCPDFVFWPARYTNEVKPIAVFLDGFAYHKDSVDDDTAKREALVKSGRFLVWTIGWDDLEQSGTSHLTEYFNHHQSSLISTNMVNQFLKNNYTTLVNTQKDSNNFELLINLLSSPKSVLPVYQEVAFAHAFCWLALPSHEPTPNKHKYELEAQENIPSYLIEHFLPEEDFLFGGLLDSLATSEKTVEISVTLPHSALANATLQRLIDEIWIHVIFDDADSSISRYKQDLFGFWKILNLLQLLPNSSWCSRKGISAVDLVSQAVEEEGSYSSIDAMENELTPWEEQLEYTDISGEPDLLVSSGLPVGLNGFDIKNDASESVAEAEFAWPDNKVALLTEEQLEHKKTIEDLGWQCFVEPVNEALIEQLLVVIGEE
ncbi:DEAD/DEAH box helicase [Vibrio diabolicus]|uniref:DEAD/DEAH box helicase n=1 Tax=Vibrio diabolicus TaxID=50719 RepID=UPI002480C04F|nr:DEAD/DEAH box helicase [Vibrio diabolicus]